MTIEQPWPQMTAHGQDEGQQDSLFYKVFSETLETGDRPQNQCRPGCGTDKSDGQESKERWWIITTTAQSAQAKESHMQGESQKQPLAEPPVVEAQRQDPASSEHPANEQFPKPGALRLQKTRQHRQQKADGKCHLKTLDLQQPVAHAGVCICPTQVVTHPGPHPWQAGDNAQWKQQSEGLLQEYLRP